MDGTVTIYALCDDTGVRYSGQTTQPLAQRAYQHVTDLRSCSPAKAAWIEGLRARGLTPQIKLLETTDSAHAHEAERRHIREARQQGCQLVNGNQGGAHLAMRPSSGPYVRYSLRLPRDLYDDLVAMSAEHGCSLHEEILRCLRAHTIHRRRQQRRDAGPAEKAAKQLARMQMREAKMVAELTDLRARRDTLQARITALEEELAANVQAQQALAPTARAAPVPAAPAPEQEGRHE